jgi:hypothetical protein
LASVVIVSVVVLSAGISSAASTALALEGRENQDLGSASTVIKPATRRIAIAITGRILLDVICMFCFLIVVSADSFVVVNS